MAMNPAIRDEWADALESGEYEQGKGWLRNGNKYCCLGVLCDIAMKHGITTAYPGKGYGLTHPQNRILPHEVIAWAGLPNYNPDISYLRATYSLGALNDNGVIFPQIAKLIREQL